MNLSRNTLLILGIIIASAIIAHQWTLHGRRAKPSTETEHVGIAKERQQPSRIVERSHETKTNPAAELLERLTTSADEPQDVTLSDRSEDPAYRRLMLEHQIRRMREYAATADPDDPFAVPPEDIEAFRQRGDPTLL